MLGSFFYALKSLLLVWNTIPLEYHPYTIPFITDLFNSYIEAYCYSQQNSKNGSYLIYINIILRFSISSQTIYYQERELQKTPCQHLAHVLDVRNLRTKANHLENNGLIKPMNKILLEDTFLEIELVVVRLHQRSYSCLQLHQASNEEQNFKK